MNRGLTFGAGAGLGAALMYVLDPDRGNRRRALMRDKVAHAASKVETSIGTTSRDFKHRTQGLMSRARELFSKDAPIDDVLEARVRSKMGRLLSHPSAVQVSASHGQVTLSGPILESEVGELLKCVAATRGVTDVRNNLEVHRQPGNEPALQGESRRPGERFEFMQQNWSPTARLLAGAAGTGAILYGAARRGPIGLGIGILGAGLVARSTTNRELKRLVGIAGRRAIDIEKTINIAAPIGEVFNFWNNYENFPRFMSHLIEVVDQSQGRSRWRVAGPAGVPVEWEAALTRLIPNQVIAWKSLPGSIVKNAGSVTFHENDDGTTKVQVRMSYNPPAGAVGHTLASLIGSDPKRTLDEDLLVVKKFLETGKAPERSNLASSATQSRTR